MDAVPHVARLFPDVGILRSRDRLSPILTCRGDAGSLISFPFSQRNNPLVGRTPPSQAGRELWLGDFVQINGSWYAKRGTTHTYCNTCKTHTDQVIYQNEDTGEYIYFCSCWTDSITD